MADAVSCPIKVCKAECCGPAPMPRSLYERNKSRLQREVTELILQEGHVAVVDNNLVCGFLGADHRCAIYNERPQVCRMFGDPAQSHPRLKCHHLGQIVHIGRKV